jgi:TetR/AcrR family transcriptional regulator, cholesterol catabolism regulator
MEKSTNEILEKVSLLYQKYGIKSVTMDDVARELGVSKKTLYQNFSDKDDLVKKVIQLYISQQNVQFREITSLKLNAVDTLFAISRHVSQFLGGLNPSLTYDIKKYYPDAWNMLMEHKREHIFNNVISNIRQGIKEGYYRTDLNSEIVARLYVSRIEASMDQEMFPGSEFSPPMILKEIFSYHIRGIASKKGIEYLEHKLKTEQL